MSTDAVVEQLYLARRDHVTGLDLSSRSLTLAAGLALQLEVLDRFAAAGDGGAGWKASFTSGRGRDLMGVGFRPFGYIQRSRLLKSGGQISLRSVANLAIEPELCLILARPLEGDISSAQARAAVDSVAAAFELNETRCSPHADNATILADGINNWGIVVGDTTTADAASTGVTAELLLDGKAMGGSTPGESMDDPFLTLARVCAELAKHGRRLSPGDHVITGSFARVDITAPGHYRATFSGIGEVAVEVQD